jgi:glucan phosphoethanolaminetransferase (alkaline phosphatase superfamily)
MEEGDPEAPLWSSHRNNRLWFYLEFIPITLLSLGIFMRHRGSEWWPYLVIGGGLATALIYLLFSTTLLNARRSSSLEMFLSLASGLLVAYGVLSLIGKYLDWANAAQMVLRSIYGGLGMVFVVAIAFLFNIRQAKSARFYRDLLARLFIFIALVYSLGI